MPENFIFFFIKKLFALLLMASLISCFGGADKRGSIVRWNKQGLVVTEGGRFRVGLLSDSWYQKKFDYRAVLFAHKHWQASIAVSSFCKNSFDDGPLPLLTRQLFYDVVNQKTLFQKKIRLEDRDALRTAVSGRLDGALMIVDTVVLKMNECVYDFTYVAAPDYYSQGTADFEKFYKGFHYLSGP